MNSQEPNTQNTQNPSADMPDEQIAQVSGTNAADFSADGVAESLNFDALNESPISALESENAQLKDQLLRTIAEMENVRRRAAEEVSKAHKFSIEKFAESMVPVQDSLEKALQDTTGDLNTLREGVELTFKQFTAALEKSGVIELNPKGEKFDPHFHQAITMIPSELESGMVVDVLQKGFKIADRVLRPALVVVSQ